MPSALSAEASRPQRSPNSRYVNVLSPQTIPGLLEKTSMARSRQRRGVSGRGIVPEFYRNAVFRRLLRLSVLNGTIDLSVLEPGILKGNRDLAVDKEYGAKPEFSAKAHREPDAVVEPTVLHVESQPRQVCTEHRPYNERNAA